MIVIKNILIGTDFSDVAGAALVYARALARNFGATLHVANVVETFFTVTGLQGYISDAAGRSGDIEQTAQRQLDATVTDDDRRTLHAKAILLNSDRPALALVQYAKDASIDLIVIGTHGQGGMARLLIGSVAERVTRLAPCPVLVVRHPEREFVLQDEP